jgi:plastocyanin
MTKYIVILVVLLAVGAGFFYFQEAEAPSMTDDRMAAPGWQPPTEENMEHMGTNPQGSSPSMTMEANPTVTIDISGKNFEFDKKEIRVKEGDIVQINFVSASGFHDWVVDEFNARTAQVRDGGQSSVTFVADKKGTFEYYCSVGQHRANGMVGKLIVE